MQPVIKWSRPPAGIKTSLARCGKVTIGRVDYYDGDWYTALDLDHSESSALTIKDAKVILERQFADFLSRLELVP